MKKINLNKNTKVIVAALVVVLAVVLGFVVTRVMRENDLNGVATISKKLIEDKKYGNLTFSDIEVIEEKELNHIAINVENHSNENFKQEYVNIVFRKENNDVIDTVGVVIPDTEANGNSRIDMVVDQKVLKSYTFTIEKNK